MGVVQGGRKGFCTEYSVIFRSSCGSIAADLVFSSGQVGEEQRGRVWIRCWVELLNPRMAAGMP